MTILDTARELLKLAAKATPGPWLAMEPLARSFADPGYRRVVEVTRERRVVYAQASLMWRDESGYTWGTDAPYIAAANPEAVAALCRALLALDAALRRLCDAADRTDVSGGGVIAMQDARDAARRALADEP